MQVSVETTGALGRRMTVRVPPERMEEEFQGRLKRLSKQVKLPGFRPGKVPLKVVEAKYGGELVNEIVGELIQSSLQEALGQEGLQPAGGPRIEPKQAERGKELEYVAEFEVYPEIQGADLKGASIRRPVCQVEDADIDRTIETLQRQRAQWNVVERAAANGDQVVIDFVGRLEGETFAGGEGKDYALELGSGRLIEGFEEGLVGASAGETRTLNLKFPEAYQAAHLAGKDVSFEVTVKEVRESVLPEVDADFIKELGVASGELEEFRAEVRKNLEREAIQRQRSLLHTRVFDVLMERNPVEVPQALVEQDLRQMRQGAAGDSPVSDAEREQAERRVRIGLIFGEIVRKEGIKAEAKAVRARVEELAAEYEKPEEFVQWFYSDASRLREIEGAVLEDLVVARLLESAEVSDETISFLELSNPGTA
jgi:trigger factor